MSIDFNLICDNCGRVINGSTISIAIVRATAKREGAGYRYKNKDYCRRCYADKFKSAKAPH